MTSTILSTNSTTAVSLTSGDYFMETPSGALLVGGSAITATTYASTILLNGSVYGSGSAIYGSIGYNAGIIGTENIVIGAGANVSSGNSVIYLSGSYGAGITNGGTISGFASTIFISTGISLFTPSAGIVNTGVITAGYAVSLSGSALSNGNTYSLDNAGTIIGQFIGVTASLASANTSSLASFNLTNSGLIQAPAALSLGVEPDTVVNAGLIVGSVSLGAGDDTYSGALGHVSGPVSGGLGSDVLTGGTDNDVMYGDNATGDTSGGVDVLSGGRGDDVLYGGFGADQLYGNQDNDVLYGNQDNDWMHGGQGNDVLYGGQGDDILNGGVGDDVLIGGVGNDTFVFSPGFGHDVIVDFGNGADVIQFQPGAFANFADVQAHEAQTTGGVLITDASGDSVFIVGATTGGLTAAQFVFG